MAEAQNKPYGLASDQTPMAADPIIQVMSNEQLQKAIERTRSHMTEAAKKLEFLEAAQWRDELFKLEDILKERQLKA